MPAGSISQAKALPTRLYPIRQKRALDRPGPGLAGGIFRAEPVPASAEML